MNDRPIRTPAALILAARGVPFMSFPKQDSFAIKIFDSNAPALNDDHFNR